MPFRVVRRDGRVQIRCPWPFCDFASASGVEQQAHVQTVHVSKNEFGGGAWWRGVGRITDVEGRKELLERIGTARRRRPFEMGVRGGRAPPFRGRRLA